MWPRSKTCLDLSCRSNSESGSRWFHGTLIKLLTPTRVAMKWTSNKQVLNTISLPCIAHAFPLFFIRVASSVQQSVNLFFFAPLHQLLPRSAQSCGASLFLRAHVDVFNSWCPYLKSATPQRAARGPLTQWSSRTRGACRCLPRVRRSEYKHTHKVVDRGRLKLPAAINRPSHSLLNTPEHTNKLLRRSLEPFKEQINKGKIECLDASAADELTN